MLIKLINITLLLLAVCILAFSPSYCASNFSVTPHDPISTDDSAWDNANGNIRTISGTLPNDFKENDEVLTQWGTYSNKVYCNSDASKYSVYIRLDGPLYLNGVPGPNFIPVSNLKYMYTYAGNITYTEEADSTSTKVNYQSSYISFSTSNALIYTCGTSAHETPPSPNPPYDGYINWEHQFKYAVQVPNDQLKGTYRARIYYTMDSVSDPDIVRWADISVVVGDLFRLSADRGSADFEKMKPGETKDNVPVEGVIVLTSCNTGNPWYLKINNDSPLSSGPYVISNTNLIWYGWSDGSGRWYGTGSDPISLAPMLMYSSAVNEGNNLPDGTKNHLKFKLTVPKGQPGGKYMSNIKLTLTE